MTIEDQPAPIPVEKTGREPVWPLVIKDLEKLLASQHPSEVNQYSGAGHDVIDDMEARDAVGRERYGTPLTANNGRNQLVDAYQELLDFLVYLRAKFEEIGLDVNEEIVDEKWAQLRAVYLNSLGSAVLVRFAVEGSL